MIPRNRSFLVAALSLLVLALAGCGGDGDAGGDTETSTEAAGPATAEISVTGQDDLKWSTTELRATAGEVTVELTCQDAVNHDFVIEELDDQTVVACDPGQTATGTVELDPGTYTFYCSVPGHREAGMEGTLTVEG